VTAHQPATGQELWRYTGMNPRQIAGGRIVPSAVTAPGFIFACGPKREIMVAVKHGLRGTLGDEQVAWKRDRNVPDVCTPLYYLNKLFVLDGDRQVLTCLNPPDGGLVWEGRLPLREVLSASPTGADGKIFCVGEEGTVAILSAGDRFEIMATIPLGEGPCRSSIVVSDRRLLVRTAENLYCF
jgi:outer membrane protein assembly factor BamB